MPQKVLIKRTSTANSPPTGLDPGELAVEMGVPTRLWVGVPTALDATGKKQLTPSGGVAVAETPPTTPKQGDLWYESDTGIFWLYYDDGNSLQWVQLNGVGASIDAYTKAESDTRFVNVPGDTMTGDLTISKAGATLSLNKASTTDSARIFGQMGGAPRWLMEFGTGNPETGSNVGSDFGVSGFGDTGTQTLMFGCRRPDGLLFTLFKFGLGFGSTPDAYGIQGTPTSVNHYSDSLATAGMYMLPSASAWTALSDARLPYKVTAAPVTDVLSRLNGAQLYSNVGLSGKQELFFKAQELATTLPELVDEGSGPQTRDPDYVPEKLGDPNAWGVMYDRAGAVALQAIKELKELNDALTARVAALEGAR